MMESEDIESDDARWMSKRRTLIEAVVAALQRYAAAAAFSRTATR